jgi:hypothetical protein
VLTLLSADLLDPTGISTTALNATTNLIQNFPPSLIEQIIIYSQFPGEITWENIPSCVKEQAEMSFYNGYELEDAYRIYGVDPAKGAMVVVRPDGYVGVVVALGDVAAVEGFLQRIIKRV